MSLDPIGIQALLFDLDGTLIDSSADLAASGNALRATAGLPSLELATVAGFVGDGIESLVRRLLSLPEGDVEEKVEWFRRHYHQHCLDKTRLYAGVDATLRVLAARGLKMAVVTNKPERISIRILDGLGIGPLFGAVIGGNSCGHKKPHPEPLFEACRRLNAAPAVAAMVGDSRVDIEAARNAGMPGIALSGGIGDNALMLAAGPSHVLQSFDELATLFGATHA